MRKLYFFIFLLSVFFSGCQEKEQDISINEQELNNTCLRHLTDVIVHDIFSPPVASRIYAYSNLAWYEAIKFEDRSAVSICEKLKGFEKITLPEEDKKYNFKVVALSSFFKVATTLVFSKDSLTKHEKNYLRYFKNKLSSDIYNNSVAFGESIAAVILKRAANDNYKMTRGMPKYTVSNTADKWQQTPPDYADAAEPHWKLITPLLLDSAAQFKPAPPPAYSLVQSSKYYTELIEVYNTSKSLTAAQDTIARYWDDNPFVTMHKGHLLSATKKITPGGHWMGITTILCSNAKTSDVKTAAAYALTSAAIFDGFISCWAEKYSSQMVRPITVIRDKIDPIWESKLQTPPFPEYSSGHSVITAAASTVLTANIGKGFAFTDTTENKYLGLIRSFSSIEAAADETGISRLYGGIHYRSAITEGKKQGNSIGELYNKTFPQFIAR